MAEMEDKGPLIKKKSRGNTLERPKAVIRNIVDDFDPHFAAEKKLEVNKQIVSQPQPQSDTVKEQPAVTPAVKTTQRMSPRMDKPVNNSERMIKMSKELHTNIMALGSFMDERKGYNILEKLVQHYTEHQLTDRQRDQLKFLVQILANEKK